MTGRCECVVCGRGNRQNVQWALADAALGVGLCQGCVNRKKARVVREVGARLAEGAFEFAPGVWVEVLEQDLAAVQALFDAHVKDAKKFADCASVGLDWHTKDALRNAALEGLWDAAQKFDAGLGWKFMSFAAARINGAIRDEQRRLEPMKGRRGRGYWADHAVPVERSLNAMRAGVEGDDGRGVDWEDVKQFGSDDSPIAADLQERLERGLTVRQRGVLRGLVAGKRMCEIGEEMGISDSRVSQIVDEVRGHCRRVLEGVEV